MATGQHDLSITSYALLGVFVVGQELFGLLGLCLSGGWIGLSLIAALVNQLR